jgi:hypothetical protein
LAKPFVIPRHRRECEAWLPKVGSKRGVQNAPKGIVTTLVPGVTDKERIMNRQAVPNCIRIVAVAVVFVCVCVSFVFELSAEEAITIVPDYENAFYKAVRAKIPGLRIVGVTDARESDQQELSPTLMGVSGDDHSVVLTEPVIGFVKRSFEGMLGSNADSDATDNVELRIDKFWVEQEKTSVLNNHVRFDAMMAVHLQREASLVKLGYLTFKKEIDVTLDPNQKRDELVYQGMVEMGQELAEKLDPDQYVVARDMQIDTKPEPEPELIGHGVPEGQELITGFTAKPVSVSRDGWRRGGTRCFGWEAATIAIDGIDNLPTDARVAFIDRKLDRQIAVDEETEYSFYLNSRDYVISEDEARFRIIVGSESFVQEAAARLLNLPTRAALHQNYPNPFNPSTIIRYDVAELGMVTLRVYTVTGALVAVLESRPREPGRYEVAWNGKNDRGEQVSSGIYFCRLTTPGYSQTRKMVMVR